MKIGMLVSLCFAALLSAAGCRAKEQPAPAASTPPPAATNSVVEPADAADANVDIKLPLVPDAVRKCTVTSSSTETRTFRQGQPIALTMQLNESPDGLRIGAKLMRGDEEIAYANVPAGGKKEATVTIAKATPGKYRLEGYWGGNLVCQQDIEVTK